jgi:outer membrane protein assembly factor BamB
MGELWASMSNSVRVRRLWSVAAFATICGASCSRDTVVPSLPQTGNRVLPETLIAWRDSLVSSLARPVFDDSSVYALGTHIAYGVDKSSGRLQWSTPLVYPAPIGTGALQGFGTAIAAGTVIIGDIDVFGLDPRSGAIRWRFAPRTQYPNEREFQRLATDGKTVYVGGVWGNVYAIDAASGVQQWISHVTALPDSFVRVFDPVVDRGVVFVSFADDTHPTTNGGVAAFDANTGRRLWSTTFARENGSGTATEVVSVAVTATRAVAGSSDGYLYGLDRVTGAVIDTIPPSVSGYTAADSTLGTWFHVSASGQLVAVGVQSKSLLLALDANDLHHVLWKSAFAEGGPMDVLADSSRVYTSWAAGQFSVTDALTGQVIWWVEREELRPYVEEILAAPAVDVSRIYVTADKDLYAFKRM